MDDVIGIRVIDGKHGERAFVTWGRLFDVIDCTEVLAVVRDYAARSCGLKDIDFAEVCWSLREIEHHQYFYEALLHFAWEPPPFGRHYKKWARRKKKMLRNGRDIYYLGAPRSVAEAQRLEVAEINDEED